MTKNELKELIKESIRDIRAEEAAFNEDVAIIESCELNEDICFNALQEEVVRDKDGNIDAAASAASVSNVSLGDLRKKKNEIAKEVANSDNVEEKARSVIASKLGKNFKVVGNRIVSIYSGEDGKGKQIAAIAVAATALAASIAAIAYSIKKKKNKEEAKKEEDKKENK